MEVEAPPGEAAATLAVQSSRGLRVRARFDVPTRPLLGISADAIWEGIRFGVVGLLGFAVNLAVFWALESEVGITPPAAAVGGFAVAVTNNHLLHRVWTFGRRDTPYLRQGLCFLVVSLAALGVNLAVLHGLLVEGFGVLPSQAIAIAMATPASYVGNRAWTFRSLA